jgi:trimeric autotransporter adhesin
MLASALTACFDGGRDAPHTVTGTISGMQGSGLTLQINGGGDLRPSANGRFEFAQALMNGAAYSIDVRTHPSFPAQMCTVTNGTGTIHAANASSVVITCSNLPVPFVQAEPNVRAARVTWDGVEQATRYELVASSARNCSVDNYASCPDGALLTDVSSPHSFTGLRNGRPYFFRVQTVYANGTKGLSNEAGARPGALSFGGAVPLDAAPIGAIAPAGNGVVYLGGGFTQVGIASGSAVPLDAATGRFAIPDFPTVDGPVFAIAADGKGGWYLGGAFAHVAGQPRNNLAHTLANGALDTQWNPNNSEHKWDEQVSALAVSSTGTVYVGGKFNSLGAVTRQNLAAVGSNGEVTSWSPTADGQVRAIAAAGSTIYVGGDFTIVSVTTRDRLAAIDANGELTSWNPGVAFPATRIPSSVDALALSGNGLYVGGRFSSVGGAIRHNLAAFDVSNGTMVSWAPDADGQVLGIAVSGSTVYVGGNFRTIAGVPRNFLAAVDAGGAVTSWNPGVDDIVDALTVLESSLYVGGYFRNVGGAPRNYLASVDAAGAVTSWNPGADYAVHALAASAGTVYAGGEFRIIGGVSRNHLAALDSTGALTAWNPNANGPVFALAVSGSTVFVGGMFTALNDVTRTALGAVDASGEVTSWNPGVLKCPPQLAVCVPDGRVFTLAVFGDVVYAGGDFSAVNGLARQNLAAVDTGGVVAAWSPASNGRVSALTVSGNNVYVGGYFTTINGVARSSLAAIDVSGALTPWTPDANGSVFALAATPGGRVYAGGEFEAIGTVSRNHLAAFDTGGALLAWNPDTDGSVRAMAVSNDTLYFGGDFGLVNGATRDHLAAVDADGGVTSWNPVVNGQVLAVAVSSDVVYVGGRFTAAGDALRIGFTDVGATSGAASVR